jgi:hypothetical protein
MIMEQYFPIGTKMGTMLETLKQCFYLKHSFLPLVPTNVAQWRKRSGENVANPSNF